MNVGVLGTGAVGRTLAAKITALGHDVMLGTRDVDALLQRDADDPGSFADWHAGHGDVRLGTFAAAAAHGEIIFNASAGTASLQVLQLAGVANLDGKILVDVANPLDFSQGFPPRLSVANDDSLGEQIQRALPTTRVVKALNTVNAAVMVDPAGVGDGDHDVFICGDDDAAKAAVHVILRDWFGWRRINDLGAMAAARGTEMYLALWVRLIAALGTPAFNVKLVQ